MIKYQAVAAELADLIATGLEPGSRLGTHAELVDRFQVSRGTITAAIGVLEQKGLVVSQQGRGTFVRAVRQRSAGTILQSFSESVGQQGSSAGGRLISLERRLAGETDAHLDVAAGTPVVQFERVRTIDGQPVGLHRVVVPAPIADRIELEDRMGAQANTSLYGLFEQHGIRPDAGTEEIDALNCDRRTAELLDTEEGSALLRVVRRTRDAAGVLLELVDAQYVPDRYQIRAVARRAGGSGQGGRQKSS